MTGSDDERLAARVACALAAEHIRNAVGDAIRRLGLADRRQSARPERIGLVPGTGAIDDGSGSQLDGAAISCRADDEGGVLAARALDLVVAFAADGKDPSAELQGRVHLRQCGEGLEDPLDDFSCQGQQLVGWCPPARRLQQPAHRGIDVVAPGGEQPDVAVVEEVGADAGAGLEHDERNAALQELCGGSESDRAGS